jgi:hypothetical protein
MKPDEIKTMVKDNSNREKNPKLLSKLLSLPVEQKACLFILFMGVLGTRPVLNGQYRSEKT